jgi:glucose-6-phosphate isomerase
MPEQGSIRITAGMAEKGLGNLTNRGIAVELVPKIMNRRPEVYSTEKELKSLIGNRLGWVDVASMMKGRITEIEKFGQKALADGIKHVVLVGMGGSSLCPEVFKLVYGKHKRLKSFDVLDSTDPSAVAKLVRRIDVCKSLFIIASKSGGTLETRSHEAFFIERLKEAGVKNTGSHMAAITDKGSSLEKFAVEHKYRKVFINPSDIGGRYSALSYFGLVPGYFAGANLARIVDDGIFMEQLVRSRRDDTNPALILGALLGASFRLRRNKITFLSTRSCAPFVPWIEQLIAESTGKQHRGIVPIEGEPVGQPEDYSRDRIFVMFRMAGEHYSASLLQGLVKQKAPVVEITLGGPHELGRQFVLWEAATAVAGYFLRINPFDEPNVTESKENTNKLLAIRQQCGRFPFEVPLADWGKLALLAAPKGLPANGDPVKFLKRFMVSCKSPSYFSLLGYFGRDARAEQELSRVRTLVRGKRHVATLRGYGPRFLHSIGQLYKGGPKQGIFVVFVKKRYGNLPIPGRPFDFGQLITAQAFGDSQALIKRRLPTLVFSIDGNVGDGLAHFYRLLHSALA